MHTHTLPEAAVTFLQGLGIKADAHTLNAQIETDQSMRFHFEYNACGFCLSLLRNCPYEREAEAERLLRLLDLRAGMAYPVAIGSFRDELLLSIAIPEKRCTLNEIEGALSVLVSLGQAHRS